ncbi:MAG: phosphotransferase family protein [Deltaproteobacteria bacterium]|nr:MAG: phosphotransferase family protein [Deltaproteobacteria bacterium]
MASDEELRERLERFLRARTGRDLSVRGFKRLAGGASARLYGFELDDGEAPARRLVMRMDPERGDILSSRAAEYALLATAREAGVRVPEVHWFGDAGAGLGAAFFVMDHVDGESLGRRLLRETRYSKTRERLPADLARELARIHAIDPTDPRLREHLDREPAGVGAEIERYRTIMETAAGGHPMPVLELAGRWLERAAPSGGETTLVHGDFRIGNVLFDENGLTAVLDWELSHAGDPMEDLGWLCVRAWRFGADDLPAGGLCSREHLWSLYEQASGRRVDPERAMYWEIFGNWKWAIICMVQAAGHKAGRFPDVELAAIGRRVAEVEWELLDLLEQQGSHAG